MKEFTMPQKVSVSTLIFCVLLFCAQPLNAQERTPTKTYLWEKVSGILTYATGCSYNKVFDEWIENTNFIYKEKKDGTLDYKYYSSLWNAPNFNSLQFKTITFDNNKYCCLVYKQNQGKYQYPNIQADWQSYEATTYYVYTKNSYNKLLYLSDEPQTLEHIAKITIPPSRKMSEADVITLIKHTIDENQEPSAEPFYAKKHKNVVRFLIPIAENKKVDFQTNYFEVPAEEFNKLIIR